jgi:hypothetical protein
MTVETLLFHHDDARGGNAWVMGYGAKGDRNGEGNRSHGGFATHSGQDLETDRSGELTESVEERPSGQ